MGFAMKNTPEVADVNCNDRFFVPLEIGFIYIKCIVAQTEDALLRCILLGRDAAGLSEGGGTSGGEGAAAAGASGGGATVAGAWGHRLRQGIWLQLVCSRSSGTRCCPPLALLNESATSCFPPPSGIPSKMSCCIHPPIQWGNGDCSSIPTETTCSTNLQLQ